MKQTLIKFLSKSPLDLYSNMKQIVNNKNSSGNENTNLINNYLKHSDAPKLQIGCGFNLKQGWLNTDLFPTSHEIVKLDAGKPFPLEDNTFDFIYSEHIFEHLTFKQSCNFLLESFRVLKPNGVIRIAVPHLDFLFKLHENPELQIHKDYIKWGTEKFCENVSETFQSREYSEIYVINNFFRSWGHQFIHTYDSLRELFLVHNFSNVQPKEIGKSDFKELCEMEQHGTIIPSEFNELETMVIEAHKK